MGIQVWQGRTLHRRRPWSMNSQVFHVINPRFYLIHYIRRKAEPRERRMLRSNVMNRWRNIEQHFRSKICVDEGTQMKEITRSNSNAGRIQRVFLLSTLGICLPYEMNAKIHFSR